MPATFRILRDGRAISGLDWGGQGPDVLFLHPNGFCAGVFEPLVARLQNRFRCLGIDLCGHGASDPPSPLDAVDYPMMVADVIAVLDELGLDRLHLVGHSLGGGVGILLDREAPGRVERLVLCEAVVFAERPPPSDDRPPMAEIARKRRAVWPDRATMRASYAAREPLNRLDPEALDAYLRYGVHDRPDGQVELACPPELEATIFEITPTRRGTLPAWEHLPRLAGRAVIASGLETTLGPLFALQAEASGCPHVTLPGSHFFPQEDPDGTAALVRAHLS